MVTESFRVKPLWVSFLKVTTLVLLSLLALGIPINAINKPKRMNALLTKPVVGSAILGAATMGKKKSDGMF